MGRRFVYVGNAETRDISAFALDETSGALTPVGTFAVPAPSGPCSTLPLAVSPDRRLLFAAMRNQPWSVHSFAIGAATGRLDHVGSGPLADNIC